MLFVFAAHSGVHVLTVHMINKFIPGFWWCPCFSSFQFFALSYYVSLRSEFRVVMSVTMSAQQRCLIHPKPPVVCRSGHALFTLLVFACAQLCPTHIVLCFCFVLLRLVYSMLPVSLDCLFQIKTYFRLHKRSITFGWRLQIK